MPNLWNTRLAGLVLLISTAFATLCRNVEVFVARAWEVAFTPSFERLRPLTAWLTEASVAGALRARCSAFLSRIHQRFGAGMIHGYGLRLAT